MWIDTNRLRFDDFDPNEPSEGEPLSDEEYNAMERDRRAEDIEEMNAVTFEADEYPF